MKLPPPPKRPEVEMGSVPPTPNFKPSIMPRVDRTTAKWISIGMGVVSIIGACTVTAGQVIKELKQPQEIEAVKTELGALKVDMKQLQDLQKEHLESDETFRVVVGAAWRKNPMGEVILRGVNQDSARVWQESMDPPAWRVSEEVKPLPRPK